MKKGISVLFSLIVVLGFLSGCGGSTGDRGTAPRLRVVTTIFPEYDWVRQILGDRASGVDLKLLLDDGVDLHSYQPTADDMVKLSDCDLFIYVGGESDEWVEGALAGAANPRMAVLKLMDVLGDAVKQEEVVEGMQAEAGDAAEDAAGYDEHVWLSLRNAKRICETIADRLGEIDPENRDAYAANAAAYIEKLDALDLAYQAAVETAPVRTLLFGDRFPFRYLADDYALEYYAAFSGCSAETEASFETVIFLANKVDELDLPAVLTIETGDGKIARTVVDSTGAKTARILQMDSLQSVSAQAAEEGAAYLGVMEQNLEILRQALRTPES